MQTYIESESLSKTYVMSIDNRSPRDLLEAAKEEQVQDNLIPNELEIVSPDLLSKHLLALYPLALSVISSVAVLQAPPPPPNKSPTLKLVQDHIKVGDVEYNPKP